jgi:hypothetical protein
MATVRKRILLSGLVRWQAGYVDGAGERRFKMFARKSDAEAWLVETRHDVARGLHTPGSLSPTLKEAAALWIKRCNEKGLEPMTVKGYEEHVDLHIVPFGLLAASSRSFGAGVWLAPPRRPALTSIFPIAKIPAPLFQPKRNCRPSLPAPLAAGGR